jgi:RHS repeat-associated protein
MARRILATLLIFLAFVCLKIDLASGQITNVTNDTITPIEGVGHDYIKMMSETVNPANGGLNIHIALPVAKSRGLTVPFSITYDSNNVHHLNPGVYTSWGTVGWEANSSLLGQGGWAFALPYARLSSWTENVAILSGLGSNGPIYTVYNCGNVANYVMLDLSGVTHSLGVNARSGGGGDPNNLCGAYSSSPGSDGKVEGFLAAYSFDQFNPPLLTANDDVGTVYKFSAFKMDNPLDRLSQAALADTVEDRNGNIARLAINASNAVSVTDSSGRTSISTSGFGPSGSTNNVTVSGQTFQVTWRTVSANFSTQSVWAGAPGWPDPVYDICSPPPSASDSQTVVSQITLPNGKSYQFYYGNDITPHSASSNPYGLVSEIDYPTGAWVTYSWKLGGDGTLSQTLNELADFSGLFLKSCEICGACSSDPTGCPAAVPDGCRYQYKTPMVASRQVSFGGSSPALTQSFQYYTNWGSSLPSAGWTSKTTTVTTTDYTTGKSASTTYSYKPVLPLTIPGGNPGSVPPQIAVEQSESYSDWNGTLLRTITKDWLDQFDIILDQTTIPVGSGSISSKRTYTYVSNNPFIREPQEMDEYDFGISPPSPPTRKTATTYQSFSGALGTLAGAPCKVVTSDASGNAVSETDYLYDNGATVCLASGSPTTAPVSGLASGTHDDTNYPNTPSKPRANVTTITKWLNGGTSPSTSYSYDKTGHVISATDACGNTTCSDVAGTSHTTQYSYNDAYTILSGGQNTTYTPSNGATNALLTKITDPLGHIATFTYDYNTSELTSATDQNSQTTSYIYNDVFARPTQVNAPDGTTKVVYNDAPPSPTITTCTLINGTASAACSATSPPTGWKVNQVIADGMGHPTQTQLVSDPEGTTYVDTTYDGFGRVKTVSNPYRDSGHTHYLEAMSYGTSSYAYDALGRTLTVTQPDGSTVTTSYSGNTTTVTDEANNQRISTTDALGRLTTVTEDPGSGSHFNYATNYFYDTLNNLTCVEQHGSATSATGCASNPSNDATSAWRVRRFSYDSLSRLLSATNPESGTLSYVYDANGNVSTKTAPAPNQTGSATVTTNYSYDALNRLTLKSYTDGATATVKYGYDGVAPSGCTPPSVVSHPSWGIYSTPAYLIGRRSSMCDASGAAAWVYDVMGRPVLEQRLLGSANVATGYLYNRDGSMGRAYYPSGNYVNFGFTSAGRPYSVSDSSNWFVFPNVSYYPFGGLAAMNMGSQSNFTGLGPKIAYNKRLQPMLEYWLTNTAPYQWLVKRCYDFHMKGGISASLGGITCSYPDPGATGDNGNLFQVQNKNDDNRTQNFTYDALNRITSGYSNGANWGQNFTIDAWGNLTNAGSITGKANPSPVNAAPASVKNQLPGIPYDAAGDATTDSLGHTITYDAENRISSVAGVTYTYDGDGKRVKKSTGTLYWTGPGSDTIAESDLSGTINEEYMYFNGKRVARVDRPSGTVHYYVNDHLGTAQIVATPSSYSTVTFSDSDYSPYGVEIPVSGSDPNRYKFTGKERDTESGNDYFGARYYESALGRFMTPDWAAKAEPIPYANLLEPQTLNLYAYVQNEPLNNTDPDGHKNPTEDPCGDNRNFCITVTADPPKADPPKADPLIWQIYYHTRLYRWAINTSEGIDQKIGRWETALSNVLWLLQPCHNPEVGCGVVFPLGELGFSEGTITAADGTIVEGVVDHGVGRMIGDGPAGVSGVRAGTRVEAIEDALLNPTKNIKSGVDSLGRPFKVFIGKDAKVVVNPVTRSIVSVNPLSRAGAR